MLYNEDRKLRFLEASTYSETTRDSIMICFNSVSRVEKSEKMDLAEFNQIQIIDMLKSLNSRSRDYLQVMCAFFAKYYDWCYTEGLVDNVVNEYAEGWIKQIIEKTIPIEFMVKKYFAKKDLLGFLDNINDVSNKFFAYGLYLGISLEEIINVKIEDLNEKDKSLKLITGRIVNVDDLFIDLIKKTNSSSHYFATPTVKDSPNGYYEYLETSPYVLKQLKRRGDNKPLPTNVYGARLRHIKDQAGNKFISAASLYKNGLINHIIERHKEIDETLDIEKILFERISERMYVYDDKTAEFINEYGSNLTPTQLRNELKDYIEYLK